MHAIFNDLGGENLTTNSNANFAFNGLIFKIQVSELKKLHSNKSSDFNMVCNL